MAKRHNPARGIYKRGNIYWLAIQRNGKRDFIGLETDDFAAAIGRAEEIREHPGLQPGEGLETEIDRFLAYKKRQNEFTRFSFESKGYILKAFAKWMGDTVTVSSGTPAQIDRFYQHVRNEPDNFHGQYLRARPAELFSMGRRGGETYSQKSVPRGKARFRRWLRPQNLLPD